MKVFLFGAHSKRIPLSYPAYRKLAVSEIHFVDDIERADCVLVGFVKDIRDCHEKIFDVKKRNPAIRVVVLSEEPLWDTLWSGDYSQPKGFSRLDGTVCEYEFLNHFTTDIYRFEKFPYFVTTNDDYFVRYATLFHRNSCFGADDILEVWKGAPIRQAYFAEKRAGEKYDMLDSALDVVGLCGFRSVITEGAGEEGVLRVGQGWGNTVRRQMLPDWHLDKLSALDRKAYIVCGIENTHQRYYITEKIFDAYAVLGVPIYYASPQHAVHRLVPEESYINLYGLTADEAIRKVRNFRPDRQFVDAYREAQVRLRTLFSSPVGFWEERRKVLAKICCKLIGRAGTGRQA